MSVHEDTCPSQNTIFRWIGEILDGFFRASKRQVPRETSNAANIQKVKGLIDENYTFSCYELESITATPKTTVHGILASHLGLRNVYSVWVPHKWTMLDPTQQPRHSSFWKVEGYHLSNSHNIPQT